MESNGGKQGWPVLKKTVVTILTVVVFLGVFPFPAFASVNDLTNMANEINSWAPTVSTIINRIFAIMFLFGVLTMGYSKVTKTGHVMKRSASTMIWAPAAYFIIKLVVILVFSIDKNTIQLFSDTIYVLQYSGFYVSIGLILVGLLFHLFYKLIQHPEFMRWSKRLWSASAVIVLAVILVPALLGAV